MSTGTDKPNGRDTAIRNARLRLIELEIESHRLKAELARLEARREDEVADRLASGCPAIDVGDFSPASWKRVVPSEAMSPSDGRPSSEAPAPAPNVQDQATGAVDDTLVDAASPKSQEESPRTRSVFFAWKSLRAAPAWVVSLGVHLLLLAVFGLFTFATLNNERFDLMASSIDAPEELLADPVDVEIEQPEVEVDDLEEIVVDDSQYQLESEPLSQLVDPAENVGAELGSDYGSIDALPGDIGTLMSGPGGGNPGDGRRPGGSNFFGTPAEGKRFLFVIDNSGSMKEGRMESTFLQLLDSVESMSRDQYFYVIFYSNQAYPLFYPESADKLVQATRENKQMLRDWLPSVELCTGGRLIEAMELAAELRPQVVYLLSDGAFFGKQVPYMTDQQDWPFVVHTLGMGVEKPEHATNLATIAQANGGTFRLVQPSPAAMQMAAQRPIKYNRQGQGWGSQAP